MTPSLARIESKADCAIAANAARQIKPARPTTHDAIHEAFYALTWSQIGALKMSNNSPNGMRLEKGAPGHLANSLRLMGLCDGRDITPLGRAVRRKLRSERI